MSSQALIPNPFSVLEDANVNFRLFAHLVLPSSENMIRNPSNILFRYGYAKSKKI